MKEASVDIGKVYALRSQTGGEVTDENGNILETLEPNVQLRTMAQEQKWLVPDDCKVTKGNFKRALAALFLLGEGNTLPAGYTRLEYLESYERNSAWIQTGLKADRLNVDLTASHHVAISGDGNIVAGGAGNGWVYEIVGNTATSCGFVFKGSGDANWSMLSGLQAGQRWRTRVDFHTMTVEFSSGTLSRKVAINERYAHIEGNPYFGIFGLGSATLANRGYSNGYTEQVRIYNFSANYDGRTLVANYIPALDPTGAPCMFDTLRQKPFYNAGTGDFVYPTESTTYGLRRVLPDWGKLTPTGLRRLYHAPAGYKGDAYDYALEHGYKPIVETEQPEVGYWMPVWHDREDCIELEWVETEPPAEELSTIEA